jgi:hypothetical protein
MSVVAENLYIEIQNQFTTVSLGGFIGGKQVA